MTDYGSTKSHFSVNEHYNDNPRDDDDDYNNSEEDDHYHHDDSHNDHQSKLLLHHHNMNINSSNSMKQEAHGEEAQAPVARVPRNRSLIITVIALTVYVSSDMLLPLYNKCLFNGFGSQQGFHFPMTTSLIQVGLVALCLLMFNLMKQFLWPQQDARTQWIFGDWRLLRRKMRRLIVVSALFAAIITLTGLGLDKSSLNTYVLLRTSSIVWVVVLSLIFKRDRFSVVALMCAWLIALGAILLSLDISLGWSVDSKNLPGALIIIASSFCSGCATVLLRTVILDTEKDPELFMSIIDMTMLKMGMAAMFMLVPALIVETLVPLVNERFSDVVWQALVEQWPMALVTLGGVLVTLLYQSAIVAFTTHGQAISVGLVHQLVMFPQVIMYSVLDITHIIPASWKLKVFRFTPSHIMGASFILAGALLYAAIKCVKLTGWYKRQVKDNEGKNNWKRHLFDIL